jgi:hypothetical protein
MACVQHQQQQQQQQKQKQQPNHHHQEQQDFGLLNVSDWPDALSGQCVMTNGYRSAWRPDLFPVRFNNEAIRALIAEWETRDATNSDTNFQETAHIRSLMSDRRFEPTRKMKNPEPPKKYVREMKRFANRGLKLQPGQEVPMGKAHFSTHEL